MNKIKRCVYAILLLMIVFCLGSCSSNSVGIDNGKEPLSNYVMGEWSGQVDVADIMYKELESELGVNIFPESEYCDVSVSFYENGTYLYRIDIGEFAAAVGKCVEPYVSAIVGFSTGNLVDIIMQYVVNDISSENGMENGTYAVDNEQMIVTMSNENGEERILYLMEDSSLQYDDNEIGQVITFQKN